MEDKNNSSLAKRNVPVDVELIDGSSVKVFVDDRVFKSGFNPDQQEQLVLEYLRRQHKLPKSVVAEGVIKSVLGGLTFEFADEIAGAFGSLSPNKTYREAKDEYNANRRVFQTMYPKTAAIAEGVGMAAPVAADLLFGTRGLASGAAATARATQSVAPKFMASPSLRASGIAGQDLSAMYSPFNIGSRTFPTMTLESAGKGGAYGTALQLGAAETTPGLSFMDQAQQAVAQTSPSMNMALGAGGQAVASALPMVSGGLRNIGRQFRGEDVRQGIADQAALNAMQKGGAEIMAAAERTTVPQAERYLAPRMENIWGEPIDVAPTASLLRQEGLPQEQQRMLAERMGVGVVSPETGLPMDTNTLKSMLRRANALGNEAQTAEIVNALRQRGALESELFASKVREFAGETLPPSAIAELEEQAARKKPVWDAFYREAYFTGNAPNTVPLITKQDSLQKLLNSPSVRTAYGKAQTNRGNDIASNDWEKVIDGLPQELPSFEMFIQGKRNIPASTWRNNAAKLEQNWKIVKTNKSVGKDGKERVSSYVIQNKSGSVDVKTLHDIRSNLSAQAKRASEQGDGKAARSIGNVITRLDKLLGKYAPSMKSADELFTEYKGSEAAAAVGKTAFNADVTLPDILDSLKGLSNTQKRAYKASAIDAIYNGNVTIDQVLSNNAYRKKLETIVGEENLGKVLYELDVINSTKANQGFFGAPAKESQLGFSLGSHTMSILAKIPAYKFSMEFALARDIVETSRQMSKMESEIMAQELQLILSAKNIKEYSDIMSRLTKKYQKDSRVASAYFGRLARNAGKLAGVSEKETYSPMAGFDQLAP